MNCSFLFYRLTARSLRAPLLMIVAVGLLAAGRAEPAAAQDDVSVYSVAALPFLRIEPNSRAAGMGNTGAALADNAYAIFWNPAGLAFQEGMEIGFTHSTWLPDLNADLYYEYLVGKYNVPDVGTFAGHVTFLNLGENEYRTGPEEGDVISVFRSYNLAAGLSYGRMLSERFALGVGARFIYSNLASDAQVDGQSIDPASTFGLDLAGLYRTRPFSLGDVATTFSVGANLSNMGPTISYVDDEQGLRDPIPTKLRVGYAFTFDFDEYNTLTFANDFNKLLTRVEYSGPDSMRTQHVVPFYKAIFTAWGPVEGELGDEFDTASLSTLEQITMSAGLEYWYNQLFALRTGYFYEHPENGDRQFISFGAGVRYNIVGVDFSYIYGLGEQSPLSGTMRFSLLVNLAQ